MKPVTVHAHVVDVVVEAPQYSGLGHALSYICERSLTPGTLVRVPLGKREVTGIVWASQAASRETSPPSELRPVLEVLEAIPALPPAWMTLVEFAAGYYQRSLGETALNALPQELKRLNNAQLTRRMKRVLKALEVSGRTPQAQASEAQAGGLVTEMDALTSDAITLSTEQRHALERLERSEPGRSVLLHGATGSGKTQVYLHEIERVLREGAQALIMVPEINLTPALLQQVSARFRGRRVVTLHSGLTPAARLQHWLMAHGGHADVVLGTRLSVFVSLPRLRLLVVDEEHEASYKQQEGARYSARDLAVAAARFMGAKTILGSATPSLETWFNAHHGRSGAAARYDYIAMPARVNQAAMPRVRLIDMSKEPRGSRHEGASALSAPLLQALELRLQRGEQSLVLLNRRGYAPVLQCLDCGWHSQCAHCSAWRVFHKGDRSLRCHHCGWSERVPQACPQCGNLDIRAVGQGTERLEEQLTSKFPEARIARIDADAARRQGVLEAQLQRVHSGEVDILVGTQMVAKGHDFRGVTLVAAVNPDSALYSHDFRAPERLFALLSQAAGRAGRDARHAAHSEMFIQTWNPKHPLYASLGADDFASFAQTQLQERRVAGLPPWCHLALLRVQARSQDVAQHFLTSAAAQGAKLDEASSVMLYPPVPPATPRVADIERMQMLIEAPQRTALQRFLQAWQPQLHRLMQIKGPRGQRVLRWALDVDPLEI